MGFTWAPTFVGETEKGGAPSEAGAVPDGAADRDYAFGVSEPVPFGVLMVTQVPLATFFQASPW